MKSFIRLIFGAVLALLAAACAPASTSVTPTAAPTASNEGASSQVVDVPAASAARPRFIDSFAYW